MQEGRFHEAALLYEQAALAAHRANDLRAMRGNALMTVQAYAEIPAFARDGEQVPRHAGLRGARVRARRARRRRDGRRPPRVAASTVPA
jgi:hypothetical protein